MNAYHKKFLGVLCFCVAIGGMIGFYKPANSAIDQTKVDAVVNDSAKAGGDTIRKSENILIDALNEGSPTVTSNSAKELKAIESMELAAENQILALYLKRETAEIAVKDKRDGYIWFSNPVNRENDSKASPLYKSELSSQLIVAYYNQKGQLNTFNSYNDSVKKQQFKISKTDKGIKVVYQIGNISQSFDNIPKAITKQRFEDRILKQLKDKTAREDLTYKFRFDEKKRVYEIRKMQDYVQEALSKTLESIGYTKEDATQDNKENGVTGSAAEESAQFTVPIEYTLNGEHLLVTVPNKEIRYTKAYPLASLHVLKYFGAADELKAGYILVPDGSGALIHLNNHKQNAEPYNLPVYGNDSTYDVKEKIQTNEITRLPVFGIKQNDHAFVGIITDGDATANITADISGRNDSYNTVSGKFQVVAMDFYTLSSGTKTSSVPMFQTNTYQGDIQIQFAFLSGRSASYVDMAALYRDYFVNKYHLQKLTPLSDTPFTLEVEGAFNKQKSLLGIPYQSTESLTSFSETETLLRKLKEQGISDVALRYVGWFNQGIRHTSPADVQVVSVLGGKSGFLKLSDYVKQNGIGLYPDVAFLQKYKGSSGAASFLDHRKAKIYEYDPVMYIKDLTKFSHYVLSSTQLVSTVDGFLNNYVKLGIQGLSLRDLGNEVNSDFNPGQSVNRQAALQMIVKETDKLKHNVRNLMVSGGNAYSLPHANMIVNAPTRSSRTNITDEDVPFYQIALHGYYDIAGQPFNMDEAADPRVSMLKALETGSNIYYQWFYSDSSKVKDTEYNHLYALSYRDWFDEAVALYKEANAVLRDVRHKTIASHRKLADGVVQTSFENGKSILINYNKMAVQVNGKIIGAQSFLLGGE